jgi:hypothetical protein
MRRKLLSLFVLLLASSSCVWGQGNEFFRNSPTVEVVGAVNSDGTGLKIRITGATPIINDAHPEEEVLGTATYYWYDDPT